MSDLILTSGQLKEMALRQDDSDWMLGDNYGYEPLELVTIWDGETYIDIGWVFQGPWRRWHWLHLEALGARRDHRPWKPEDGDEDRDTAIRSLMVAVADAQMFESLRARARL